ncbi:phage tail tape measure protein [Variovorax boronicumulans]|uniref:Phage tail tape measure protein n=1 Tax=Variovorax boronicumulans TaxID=436515 RepID=A0A250DIF0_9BURK|nr:phage tail tape measure protein [Variovorax boronicumulans]ATA53921.1 phage tail tape measure protein [Variovorax boronicumulans]
MAIKPIQILINAKDNASSVFDKLQQRVIAFAVLVAGYFGIQAFAGWIKGGADLEQALSRVQSATGATAAEMRLLRKAAVDAAADTRFNFTQLEAAGALENLAKAGLSVKDAIATLPAAMQLARAGDIELAGSAEYLTKIVNGLGLSFTESGRVADVLAKGANATNTSVTGLAQALSYAAPLANTLGLGLEFTVAIIGKFADAGIDASRAGTALNSILAQFSDPASKFRTELAAAGITSTNFEKALHELAAAGPAGQRAIAAVGQEAGPALRALLNQGVGKLDELKKSLQDAGGSAAATAAIMQANLNGALASLRTAWDSATNALTTPVLPVLKEGVEQLAGALRGAVADGTIGRFGSAIASAFQSGMKWVREFLGAVDFAAVTARAQAFAERIGALLDSFGQKAQTTSNIVQTVWGVMAGGANVVLAAMFKIAEGMANVVSAVQSGLATILSGLAKITFGDLSAAFKAAAEEVRLSAEATGAVADAFGAKAGEAFDRAAEGAEQARAGWAGLTGSAEATTAAAASSAAAFTSMAAEMKAAGDSAQDAGQRAAGAAELQRVRAEEARATVERLRLEYAQAIATGNLELAAQKLDELKKANLAAASSAKENSKAQEQAALEIAAAFSRAGIETKASLEVAAQTALRDYEIIRDSGQATAIGLGEAWKRAAEAAIAAGNGVAPGWVQAQAAMRGFEVVLDSAGRSTVKLREAQNDAMQSAHGLAGALREVTNARERDIEAREKANALKERETALENKRLGRNAAGFSTDKEGKTINAGSDLGTLTGIAAFLKAAGISDEKRARAIAMEFADAKGDIPFFNNPGQKKYANGGTLSQALMKAAEKETFFGTGNTPTAIPQPESNRTVNLHLNLNGRDYGTVQTNAAGADAIEGLLAQLGAAAGTSSNRQSR